MTGRDGRTGGSDCGDVRGTVAPLLSYSSGLDAALPPYSERWSNHLPQGFSSNVDKSWRFLQMIVGERVGGGYANAGRGDRPWSAEVRDQR